MFRAAGQLRVRSVRTPQKAHILSTRSGARLFSLALMIAGLIIGAAAAFLGWTFPCKPLGAAAVA